MSLYPASSQSTGKKATATTASELDDNEGTKPDPRTRDGKPLYITVAVSNPVVEVAQSEKFIQYTVRTETNHKAFESDITIVFRRYKEFVWLKAHLNYDLIRAKKIALPSLPPKSLLNKLKDTEFIEKRRAGLENFLKAVVSHEDLLTDQSLLKFLTAKNLPKAVGYAI